MSDIIEHIDLLLNEVFDSTTHVRMYKNDSIYKFDFTIKGINYDFIAYYNYVNTTRYPETETIENDKIEYWTIEFGIVGHHDYDKSYGITGAGNAVLVFSAVAKCFEMFINKEKPKIVFFSADEKSRVRLYDRFAKIITSKMPYKLSKDKNLAYEIGAVSGNKVYVFERK